MRKQTNTMINNYARSILKCSAFFIFSMSISSCVDKFLPSDLDSLGTDGRYTQTEYTPVLGRNSLLSNNFNPGNSSQPLTFKIINMRRPNGEPAPELTESFPVKVWSKPYLGNEKSLKEIEAKRIIEYRPLFDVRKHNGAFEMWSGAKSAFVKTSPDLGYIFDVELSNTGGRRYFRDLSLMPMKERPFEPSNLDPITGNATQAFVHPTQIAGIRGHRSSAFLNNGSVEVFFRNVVDESGNAIGTGNTIKLLFRDSLNNSIDPNKFALTKWDELLHGFNMEKTSEFVRYQVAYPIPLINYRTKYTTTDGTRAHMVFKYDRLGFGGRREEAHLALDFAIFEKGDWEITFRFNGESPKFEND